MPPTITLPRGKKVFWGKMRMLSFSGKSKFFRKKEFYPWRGEIYPGGPFSEAAAQGGNPVLYEKTSQWNAISEKRSPASGGGWIGTLVWASSRASERLGGYAAMRNRPSDWYHGSAAAYQWAGEGASAGQFYQTSEQNCDGELRDQKAEGTAGRRAAVYAHFGYG